MQIVFTGNGWWWWCALFTLSFNITCSYCTAPLVVPHITYFAGSYRIGRLDESQSLIHSFSDILSLRRRLCNSFCSLALLLLSDFGHTHLNHIDGIILSWVWKERAGGGETSGRNTQSKYIPSHPVGDCIYIWRSRKRPGDWEVEWKKLLVFTGWGMLGGWMLIINLVQIYERMIRLVDMRRGFQ